MEGYLDALKKYQIEADDDLIVQGSNDNKENYELVQKLLNRSDRPDGIFASVEKLAITTYHVCNDLGLSIPKDVKVISFSNLETASLLNPSLTTITQPAFNIGREAATILFKALDKNKLHINNEKIVLRSELIVRDSTARR
jgi:LacI family transcriptional regulator